MNHLPEDVKKAARQLANAVLAQGYQPVGLHCYTSAANLPLYWRIRLKNPETGEKWIRPMKFENGKYCIGEPTFPGGKPLYNLAMLADPAKAGPEVVWVVEGEGCVDALTALGVLATTSGGADSVERADWQPLAGRRIIIWPDFDSAGLKYGTAVASKLRALACQVTVLDVAQLNLPAKGDVVDWLAQYPNATADDLADLPVLPVAQSAGPVAGNASPSGSGTASGQGAMSDVWPEPKPVKNAERAVPAFDADVLLPTVLRDWIMDEAGRMACLPDYIAAAVMVALGSVVGARCAIKPKVRDNWLIVPNIWGGIVGAPSAKKSPAVAVALRPLERLASLANAAHQADMQAYAAEKAVFDAEQEAMKSQLKSNGKPTASHATKREDLAQALQEHMAQAPQAPPKRRFKVNDATVEKLGELLRDNPNGLLAVRDELVGMLANWDKESNQGERAFYLEAWNGNSSFDTDRIMRGSIAISNLCVSVFGGIQPDKLHGYLKQATHQMANDGMLQRFQMLVFPDPLPWAYRDQPPNKQAHDRAMALFTTLADFDPVMFGAQAASDTEKFPHFGFTPEAQVVFVEWTSELHGKRIPAEEQPIIQQHLSKYDKLFAALALLLHLAECCASGQRGAIGVDAALRAAAWCEYLEAHMRRCYGLVLDGGARSAQALAEKLMAGKLADGFTARDVARKNWQDVNQPDAIKAALEWLEDEGWLRAYEDGGSGPGSGRRTVRYLINPKVQAMQATGGRA